MKTPVVAEHFKGMNLSSHDWSTMSDCLVRLYRELDAKRHARVMLEIVNGFVPGESVVLNYFRPPHELTCITLPENLVTDEQVAAVAKYGHQSPYGAYYLATQDASWKRTTDFMPAEEFHKLDIHRHGLGPLGINYQTGGMLAMMDGAAHIITIHRTHRDFTDREQAILNRLHPHLVTSYINAHAFTQSKESVSRLKAVVETAPGAYGYFKADGLPAWVQPKAQAWLIEFFPNEVKSEGNVPKSVERLLQTSREKGGTPEYLHVRGKQDDLTVLLSASPPGGWILRLDRKPAKAAPRFRPLDELTRSQNRVLRWMVEGKRNAEIAAILGISPRTVEKHVESILNKLKVENRATAIIRAMELSAQIAAASK